MHAAETGSDDEDRYVTTVCFNEAAARTPRKPRAERDDHDRRLRASMRPRHARRGNRAR